MTPKEKMDLEDLVEPEWKGIRCPGNGRGYPCGRIMWGEWFLSINGHWYYTKSCGTHQRSWEIPFSVIERKIIFGRDLGTRPCKICGKTFQKNNGPQKMCSICGPKNGMRTRYAYTYVKKYKYTKEAAWKRATERYP